MSQEQACRHEFVKIYQRRLKGLERRLLSTKAYLPVGFRMADLSHLSEGSYCFCTVCRARLFPRRTAAEKAAAKAALAMEKQAEREALLAQASEGSTEKETTQAIDVEELELETVDVDDIEAESATLNDEE